MDENNQSDKSNRTLICSVVFLDIAEYSSQSVSKQIELKGRMDSLISEAIKGIADNERIMVDSGDGTALCFLGDPEDALFVAIHLRDLLIESGERGLPLKLRMGINLGPVRTIKDINNRLNVIGDGINVAQRVMSFAVPGKIFVSRSYFEMVSRLSEEYSNLFHYLGILKDKHIREHEIYEVSRPGSAGEASAGQSEIEPDKGAPQVKQISAVGGTANDEQKIAAAKKISPAAVKTGIAAAVGVLVLGITLKFFFGHGDYPSPSPDTALLSMPETTKSTISTTQSKPVDKNQSMPVVKNQNVPVVKNQSIPVVKNQSMPVVKDQNMPVVKDQNIVAKPPAASTLFFAVSPWGEIYIDGKLQGVSPPMSRLKVKPGKYLVKIANSTFPPYIKTIEVGENQTVSLKYKFQ